MRVLVVEFGRGSHITFADHVCGSRLQKRLGEAGTNVEIKTRRGIGYIISVEGADRWFL